MISGQLAPSSANFVPQSNFSIEDDISTTTTSSDRLYKSDKINTTFFSNTISSGCNNLDDTRSTKSTTTTSTTTFNIPITLSSTTTTATSTTPGLFNISSNNNCIAISNISTPTIPTTTNTISTINNTSIYHLSQNLYATNVTTTTTTTTATTTISSEKSDIIPTTTTTENCNAATIAVENAITDARGRSAALERAYVHDVYENCEEPTSGPIRPRVAQFLANLEPGSIVCDVGCGNGRYLTSCNPLICTIGVDRCFRLAKIARERGGEVALCDNLELPFRDESFDAVLSLAVVHHFATTERRVGAIRELARILRIGGRVIISVWALEQRHRRFESQDVLIPWQPPKNRNYNLSDDEDDDDYLPPYHAYTEDSTNSSRSAGDGDSSSLSSSSPGESCYSFVRRAIQKLAGGRKHPWFLDSWNSKDTKNDSSLDYEDAKDLPIELRRLEDFEDLPDPPLSAGLKSRSLGSILNPPPIVQIVRSRSSVPSLGAQISEHKQQQQVYGVAVGSGSTASLEVGNVTSSSTHTSPSRTVQYHQQQKQESLEPRIITSTNVSPTKPTLTSTGSVNSIGSGSGGGGRRPKLVKQKQSLCDEEYQLPDNHIHMMNKDSSNVNNYSMNKVSNSINQNSDIKSSSMESRMFLRKQSSLNEELMAENRLREKERIRKRIQKQMSLNETFLCRSLFTKRLQIIREGFTTKLKTSTGSLERVTKSGFVKIMQNFKTNQFSTTSATTANCTSSTNATTNCQIKNNGNNHQNHCSYNKSRISTSDNSNHGCNCGVSTTNNCNPNNICNCNQNQNNNGNEDQQKPRRSSRESGSDSSKDSSLQSDTSIESEDSFASVIFIPKPEQQQQQQNQSNQLQKHNNNNSSNICSKNNGNCSNSNSCKNTTSYKVPSVPTSPLIMQCPPTPAHSPAAVTSSVTPSLLASTTEYNSTHTFSKLSTNSNSLQGFNNNTNQNNDSRNRFTFDKEHIIQQQKQQIRTSPILNQKRTTSFQGLQQQQQQSKLSKITRQTIQNLPQIPKFRKQQSLQLTKASFPIVRRSSAAPAVPKLLSLEIFNPETDDLDSDSSEPSSPDSIDSVISALKPHTDETKSNNRKISDIKFQKCASVDLPTNAINRSEFHIVSTNPFINDSKNDEFKTNDTYNSLILNKENDETSTNLIHNNAAKRNQEYQHQQQQQKQSFADFAEQLSAQLLKKLEENKNLENSDNVECKTNNDGIIPVNSIKINNNNNSFKNSVEESIINNGNRKSNGEIGEIGDLNILKEELRERRLMLANLSTQSLQHNSSHYSHHQQQSSPTSSASTTSSQTRNCSINDDKNNELRYSPSLFDSKSAKRKFLRNFNENRQYSSGSVPDTAYLIPDNGGDSSFDDDDENNVYVYVDNDDDDDDAAASFDDHDIADIDEVDHDVIIEEDEDIDEDDYNTNTINRIIRYDDDNDDIDKRRSTKNTIKYLENDEIITTTKIISNKEENNDDHDGDVSNLNNENDNNNNNNSNKNNDNDDEMKLGNGQTAESWGHSNSTNSLDSPSQGGGSTTHHRYYHVFREGELDALINHHVTSLHIVSSYYERASWCVVAEKVQVWTI